MVAVEIDDLLLFGDAAHSSKMDELQRRFVFGKVEKIDERGVNFNGRRLKRFGDVVIVDTKAFVEERLEGAELPKERMKQKNDRLTEDEVSLVRGVWLTVPAERGGLMRQQPPHFSRQSSNPPTQRFASRGSTSKGCDGDLSPMPLGQMRVVERRREAICSSRLTSPCLKARRQSVICCVGKAVSYADQ